MDVIQLNNTKENELKFDVNVEKVDDSDLQVRFVIKTSVVDFSFKGLQESDNGKWIIKIPPLPAIEKSAYPFCIEVITDGYFFETMTGTINVVGSHDVYTSNVVNTTLAPPAVISPGGDESQAQNVILAIKSPKLTEKSANDIANKILTEDAKKEPVANCDRFEKKVVKTKPAVSTKDNQVKKILESISTTKTPISKTPVRKGKALVH